MSEDWHKGWYQDKQGDEESAPTQASPRPGPSFTPHATPQPEQPTKAWPGQPPSRSGEPSQSGQPAWSGEPSRSGGPYGPGGPHGPGGPRGPRGRRSGWRRWLRPKPILITVAILVVVVAATSVGLYFDFNSKLTRADVLVPTSATSAGSNWLITGSDGRGGLTAAQDNALSLGRNISGARSDTIMLLHIPSNGTKPTLISIPRDSYVDIPGHGWNKINAAYAYGGPKLLIQTVQTATGLPISHYMGIGFDGLVNVVNDVGGVHMCLPGPMKDPKSGLHLKKGCHDLTGDQALAFVRTRAFTDGDLQREQDQRQFLKALLSKMTSFGSIANPFSSIPAAGGAASSLTVDNGTQLYQLVSVAYALRDPVTTTVPFGGFGNEAVGSVVLWDKSAAEQMFSDLGNDKALPKSLIGGSSVQETS